MAVIPLSFGTFGGGSDEVTATKAQVLQGYTAITSDSDDEPINGTMTNNGAVSKTLDTGTTSYTIPQGYHNGNGRVQISTQEKSVGATTSAQNVTPDSGKVLSKVAVKALSQSNLSAGNIKKGVAVKVNNGNSDVFNVTGTYSTPSAGQQPVTAGAMLQGYSGFVNGGGEVKGNISSKSATTYNTSTSDQTIASGQYLSGAQTIKAVTTSNISADNIRKGVNVKVGDANNAGRIKNVTGTWYGNKKCIGVSAYDYQGGSDTPYEESFTMPANGMVYYGGASGGWYYNDANSVCAIYKNGTLMDERNITSGNYLFRNTMFNKSFAANAGDVIKVVASCSRGRGEFIMSCIQAVIVY